MTRSGRRLIRLWRRDPRAEVDEELAFHFDEAIAVEMAYGATRDEAERRVAARFGDRLVIGNTLERLSREGQVMQRRRERFRTVGYDLRFALRQLRFHPGFAIVALLTLGLGIAASTAIFSLVYSVLLRPLPYPGADRVVALTQVSPDGSAQRYVPVPNAIAWANDRVTFTAIGFTEWHSLTLTGVGDPVRWRGQRASAGYWRALGLTPAAGRFYDDAADQAGAQPVIVLAYGTWVSTFGADRGIVGRTIQLDNRPYTVVAVAPAAQTTTSEDPAFWIPFVPAPDELTAWGDHELLVVGRLRRGVAAGAASADLSRVERSSRAAHPDDGVRGDVSVVAMRDVTVGSLRERQLLVLLAAVGLVLLIACGNVANLLLARAMSRRGEMAVRIALGAGRGRLVRQLLSESLVLALGGAALGLGGASAALHLLLANAPAGIPRLNDAAIDAPVIVFAIAVALLAAIVFGIAPALRAAHQDVQSTLRETGRDGRGTRDPLRRALIVAEIALALMLLTGAGLLLRSASRMFGEPVGFDPDSLMTARIALPDSRYPGDAAVIAGFEAVAAQIRTIPGVRSAAMISRVPLGGGGADCQVARADRAPDPRFHGDADFRSVTPGYFETMRTPIVAGRAIDATDLTGSPPVAMINLSLAKELFGEENPVGRQIIQCIGTGDGENKSEPRTVVGVVRDVRADGLDQVPAKQVYYPVTQFYERQMTIVVRSGVPARSLVPALRTAVARADPMLPLSTTATMHELIARSTAMQRFTMLLLLVLGGSGITLAATGIYGVVAYQVAQRTRELGIRVALGATSGRVVRLVLREGIAMAVIGVGVGEAAALVAARALSTLVYGVGIHDPITFVGVGALLAVTTTAASLAPALRAARIDPIRTLRDG